MVGSLHEAQARHAKGGGHWVKHNSCRRSRTVPDEIDVVDG